MSIKYVDPKMPPNYIFSTFNDNDISNNGFADRANFNKYELDALYPDSSNRQYVRELRVGGTGSSYTNWTHVESNSGYSVWRFPVTDFVDATENCLYNNNLKYTYQGVATSSSLPTGFGNVYLSNSKRTSPTLTDYSTEAASLSGTPFNTTGITYITNEVASAIIGTKNLDYLNILYGSMTVVKNDFSIAYSENSDYTVDYKAGTLTFLSSGAITSGTQLYVSYNAGSTLYIGDTSTFSNVYIKLAIKGVGNKLEFDYSSGSNWHSFVPTLDSTNNFSMDGEFSFTGLSGWTTTTVSSGVGKYYIAVRMVQRSIGFPNAYYILKSNSAATKLVAMSNQDFTTSTYKWCYYNGNIYVVIPNSGDTVNEGITYLKSSSSDLVKQNYFIYNNEYIINHKKTYTSDTIIPSTSYYYLGSPTSDASVRIGNVNGNFVFESRISGSWQQIGAFVKGE